MFQLAMIFAIPYFFGSEWINELKAAGKLTGKAVEDIVYESLEGDGATVKAGDVIKLRSAADFSKFEGVSVDGVELDKANYNAYEGSTVVELSGDYTKTLASGKHEIVILSSDGKAIFNVVVAEEEIATKPNTDEEAKEEPKEEAKAADEGEVAADTAKVSNEAKAVESAEKTTQEVAADTTSTGDNKGFVLGACAMAATISLAAMTVTSRKKEEE